MTSERQQHVELSVETLSLWSGVPVEWIGAATYRSLRDSSPPCIFNECINEPSPDRIYAARRTLVDRHGPSPHALDHFVPCAWEAATHYNATHWPANKRRLPLPPAREDAEASGARWDKKTRDYLHKRMPADFIPVTVLDQWECSGFGYVFPFVEKIVCGMVKWYHHLPSAGWVRIHPNNASRAVGRKVIVDRTKGNVRIRERVEAVFGKGWDPYSISRVEWEEKCEQAGSKLPQWSSFARWRRRNRGKDTA